MKRILTAVALSAAFSLAAAQTAPAPTPPVAKRIHTERALNGGVLVDDYAWLRERQNPEVKSLLEAENAYADQVLAPLKPLQTTLYNEMLSHIQQTDDSVPYTRRGYLYYSRTVEGKQYPIYCRRKGLMSAPEEILLDLNAMAVGEKFMAVGAMAVSDDNNLLAYTTDTVGFRQYKLHIKDLRTGHILPDTAERATTLAWAADNKTLFYGTEDQQTKRWDMLHRHVLSATADTVVFDEKDERFDIGVERSRDGRYILLRSESHITSEWQYLKADQPTSHWTMIEPRRDGVMYSVDEGGRLFYLKVNDTGHTYRLVSAPVATPGKAHWKQLIAARPDVPLEDVEVFRDFYAVTERVQGLPVLRVIRLKTGASHTIDFPDPAYDISSAENDEFSTTHFRYTYESMVTPHSTFDYDVTTGKSKLLKQTKVPGYNPALYVTERLWATATDGTKVPVTLVYRKDLFKKGTNPLFVYGYGSYGVTIPDDFSAATLPLLDRGVVFAIAHIRGGGELGEPWHDAGKMMTKRNTFTDFIDSTEFLVQQGYGAKGRVGIEGASAGGLLMGAVTNMRPDLFKVVLCEVPFVDVMNTMLDATLPLTVPEYEEWGNPNQKPAFDYMLSYSPYDNVKPQAYPNILVRTSFDDSQVMYWEPSKYVSKLRALKTDNNTLVFLVNMHGGHGGSSGRYDSLKDRAMDDAFLLDKLGVAQ
jgi:oligopeptidase B